MNQPEAINQALATLYPDARAEPGSSFVLAAGELNCTRPRRVVDLDLAFCRSRPTICGMWFVATSVRDPTSGSLSTFLAHLSQSVRW